MICDCEDDANVDIGERGNYRGIKVVIMPMRRISINMMIFLTVAMVTMSNDDIVDSDFFLVEASFQFLMFLELGRYFSSAEIMIVIIAFVLIIINTTAIIIMIKMIIVR